jgi:hypothetical protein
MIRFETWKKKLFFFIYARFILDFLATPSAAAAIAAATAASAAYSDTEAVDNEGNSR